MDDKIKIDRLIIKLAKQRLGGNYDLCLKNERIKLESTIFARDRYEQLLFSDPDNRYWKEMLDKTWKKIKRIKETIRLLIIVTGTPHI